jgi:hypothetical protein
VRILGVGLLQLQYFVLNIAADELHELHWLPIQQRVTFKLCVFMHLIHTGRNPSYLSELVTPTSSIASRSRLRSASSRRYEQAATRLELGEWSFAFAGLAAWN